MPVNLLVNQLLQLRVNNWQLKTNAVINGPSINSVAIASSSLY